MLSNRGDFPQLNILQGLVLAKILNIFSCSNLWRLHSILVDLLVHKAILEF